MNRSCPGTSTKPISRPDGSVHHAYPRSIVSPRRFSSAQRSGSIPVSRTISDDLPWSTWPAVATTRSVARHGESVLVEVVALERVLDRAGEVGAAGREARSARRSTTRVRLDATEHRRAAGAQPRRERARGRPSSPPRPTRASTCPGIEPPPTTDWHLADVRALEVAVERLRQAMRALRQVVDRLRAASGARAARPRGPDACMRQDGLERRDLHLVHADGARDRVRAQLRDHVGPADDDPGLRPARAACRREHVTRSAPSASASTHGRLVGRHPVLVVQQARADVEDERHAALRGERRPGPSRAASR